MSGEFAAGLAAVITGIAAIITAWAAVIRARKRGNKQCEESLLEAREEAERLSSELHEARMRLSERGEVSIWLMAASTILVIMCVSLAAFATGNASAPTQGIPGPKGPSGPPGSSGPPGPQGSIGKTGPPGSASNIPGPSGSVGPQGTSGPKGSPSNVPGPSGSSGSTGPPGPAGPTGAVGKIGPQGRRGPTGPPGPVCPAGTTQKVLTVKLDRGGSERILACIP